MDKHKLEDLNKLYSDSTSAETELYAEMRSNILLTSGEHYAKKGSKFWNRVRDSKDLSGEQKLRLTKNHVQRIVKTYVNNILTYSPGVKCMPARENELQDQKAAELHQSVWAHAVEEHRLKEKISDWCNDFVTVGEVAVKIFWDPSKGDFVGMEQETDEQGMPRFHTPEGETTTDPVHPVTGQPHEPIASDRAKFSGAMVFEDIYGFNLFRDLRAKTMQEAAWIGLRKMADVKDVQAMVTDEKIKAKITESANETYTIFDENVPGGFKEAKGQVMLKEFYFKPCPQYPKGYFFITISEAIIFEGELPFGIFPIVFTAFEKLQTSPRGRSIVKLLRPYQAEINRSASAIAETQITLGQDKIITMAGSKATQGANLPGIRQIQVTGAPPTILAGRDGSQYLPYMQAQIQEMYEVAMVAEDSADAGGQMDAYASLFRSVKQKKRFSRFAERFEQFLVDVADTYLELGREYLDVDALIPAIGKAELVNISEFKAHDKLCYKIKTEPQSDDIESLMGHQLSINHALQYVGNKLEKEDIGKMMRNMPFGNFDASFDDLTIDYDTGTNLILALDRGEMPQIKKYDNPDYLVKRLSGRTRKADFSMLPPQIQANYDQVIAQCEQVIEQKLQDLQRAEAGFIPTSGYLTVVDLYVSDPMNPNNTKRARVPSDSIVWLIKALEQQGTLVQQLEGQNPGVQQDIARGIGQQQPPHPGPGPGQLGAPHGPAGQQPTFNHFNGHSGALQPGTGQFQLPAPGGSTAQLSPGGPVKL